MTEQPNKMEQSELDPIKVEVHVTRQSFEPPTLKPGVMPVGVCTCDCGSKAGGGSGG